MQQHATVHYYAIYMQVLLRVVQKQYLARACVVVTLSRLVLFWIKITDILLSLVLVFSWFRTFWRNTTTARRRALQSTHNTTRCLVCDVVRGGVKSFNFTRRESVGEGESKPKKEREWGEHSPLSEVNKYKSIPWRRFRLKPCFNAFRSSCAFGRSSNLADQRIIPWQPHPASSSWPR